MGGTPKQPNILGFANGINSNGDVVGGVGIPEYYGTLAVKWSGGGGQPTFLWQQPYDPSFGEDPSPGSEATCINDAGVIGGSDFGIGDDFYCQAFVGTTLYSSGSTVNEVYAINNAGLAVGEQNNQATIFNPPANLGSGTASGINNADAVTGRPAQIVGTLGATGVLWERKQLPTASGQPNQYAATYTPTLLNQLVNPAQAQSYSNIVPCAINDSGAIVGTATYSGTNYPTGSHGVLLLPCQCSLLNGNQSGTDGLNFDGTRPQNVSATGPDNTTVSADITALNGGTQTSIDVLGTVLPIGLGRRDYPGACYTSSLVVTAKVPPSSAMKVSYSWNRTYNSHVVLFQWNGLTQWNVNQLYYKTAQPDDTDHDYETSVPSPNGQLYIFDNPALDLADNCDSANVGDYAYLETDFTYTLTITIGTSTATRILHVGQTILAKRVDTTGITATDWQGIENVVSTSGIPNCQITFDKVHGIVGYLPFPSSQISIPSNINTPTP